MKSPEEKKPDAYEDAHDQYIGLGRAWQSNEMCCPKCGSKMVSGMCLNIDCLWKEVKR